MMPTQVGRTLTWAVSGSDWESCWALLPRTLRERPESTLPISPKSPHQCPTAFPTRRGISWNVKERTKCSRHQLSLGDRVLRKRKNSFIALPGEGGHSRLRPHNSVLS